MTAPPCMVDPAVDVINTVMDALREWFRTDQPCPPIGGGTSQVQFFAMDAGALLFDANPVLLWVRLAGRYRSTAQAFPDAHRGSARCGTAVFPVIGIEVGVERCTSVDDDGNCKPGVLEFEADRSRDDSLRLTRALCLVEKKLAGSDRLVAIDTVEPRGPEGGFLSWTGMAYVQLTEG